MAPRLFRGLAIVPQTPFLSERDKRRELALRRTHEQTRRLQRHEEVVRLSSPQFRRSDQQYAVLEAYESHRATNTPRDVAAAFNAWKGAQAGLGLGIWLKQDAGIAVSEHRV